MRVAMRVAIRVAIAPIVLYMEWVVYLIPQLPSGGKEMRETHWGNFMPTTAQELKTGDKLTE